MPPSVTKIKGRGWVARNWPQPLLHLLPEREWDFDLDAWVTFSKKAAEQWLAAVPVVIEYISTIEREVSLLHGQGICTWTSVNGKWAITGPLECLLDSCGIVVKAKDKDPERVVVTNVRRLGKRWIADLDYKIRKGSLEKPVYLSRFPTTSEARSSSDDRRRPM